MGNYMHHCFVLKRNNAAKRIFISITFTFVFNLVHLGILYSLLITKIDVDPHPSGSERSLRSADVVGLSVSPHYALQLF